VRMDIIGIIGGSSLLTSSYFSNLKKGVISTEYGDVLLHFGEGFVFCQRHCADPKQEYVPPHLINKKGIISALLKCNVKKVISFTSVGSLKLDYPFGSLVIPDDFFNLWDSISFFDDKRGHIVPTLQSELRDEIIKELKSKGIKLIESGTYVQTTGPRFETKAEIRFLSNVADVVGMTATHEAILSKEVDLPYAVISIVDNMGHGLVPQSEELSVF